MSRQFTVFLALACAGLLAVLVIFPGEPAGEVEGDTPRASRLRVGDPAPPFPVVQWVGTDSPPAPFEPGKVTVLDVWATWCGPCIRTMPHLAELRRRYAGDGLVVVPVTSAHDNSLASVQDFVQNRAALELPFAFCPGEEVARDFMGAAGKSGIPTSFVIDRSGNVAFIGHPLDLDEVLPKILARR